MNNTTDNKTVLWTNIFTGLPCVKAMLKKEMPNIDENNINAITYGVKYRRFGSLVNRLSKVSIGQPIIVLSLFEGYEHDDADGLDIASIDSGNLGECLYSCSELSEWYVDKSGEFLSYHISWEGVTYCKYLAIKKDAPFSKVQRLLSEIYNDDFDFTILGEVTESIGAKVLEALGDKRFCNKGGASCGK